MDINTTKDIINNTQDFTEDINDKLYNILKSDKAKEKYNYEQKILQPLIERTKSYSGDIFDIFFRNTSLGEYIIGKIIILFISIIVLFAMYKFNIFIYIPYIGNYFDINKDININKDNIIKTENKLKSYIDIKNNVIKSEINENQTKLISLVNNNDNIVNNNVLSVKEYINDDINITKNVKDDTLFIREYINNKIKRQNNKLSFYFFKVRWNTLVSMLMFNDVYPYKDHYIGKIIK